MSFRVAAVVCLIVSFLSIGYSQHPVDSLLRSAESDTTLSSKIDILLRAAEFYKMRNLPYAVVCTEKAIELAQKRKHFNLQLASAYELCADVSNMGGNFVRGANYNDKAIQLLDTQSDSLSLAQKYHALMYSGGWLTPLQTEQQKLEYGTKSLAIYSALKKWKEVARVHYSLGIVYFNQATWGTEGDTTGDKRLYETALYHNQQTEIILKRINGDVDQIANAIWGQGQAQLYVGQHAKALSVLLQAENIYTSTKNYIGLARVKWLQALIHQDYGSISAALGLAKQSEQFILKADYQAMIFQIYDLETELYRSTGDFRNAFENSLKARRSRDEYYSLQRNMLISEVQNNYENKLKNEQIRLLDAENNLKAQKLKESRMLYWGTTAFFVACVAIFIVYICQRQKIVKELKRNDMLKTALQKNLETQLNEAQLTAARAQMNPHFVFNTISSIQNLILKESKTEAITYLNEFSKLARQTFDQASKKTITIKDEIIFLSHYLQLEQLRCNNTFTFKIDTEQIDPDFDRIPTLLVQPLVENSIKHGLIHKQPNGFVYITFSGKDKNALIITVEDNGIGRSAAGKIKNGDHGSRALQLTELRMQLQMERKDLLANYPLHIHDKVDGNGEPSGTIVTLTVPVVQFVKEG